jgi:bacterioferritin
MAVNGSHRREDMAVDKQTIIDHLNHDLAGELSAVIQYLTYAARATGPHRPQLAEFFAAEIPDEIGHAQYLAKKIVALGGTPTTVARAVPEAKSNREMMEAVLAAEEQAIADYSTRAQQAEEFGDKGLQVQLEDIVRDETGHFEETQQILRNWDLN